MVAVLTASWAAIDQAVPPTSNVVTSAASTRDRPAHEARSAHSVTMLPSTSAGTNSLV